MLKTSLLIRVESNDNGNNKNLGTDSFSGARVIIGVEEKNRILEACHSNPCGGAHFGVDNTIRKIGERFWWKGFTEDAKKFVRQCPKCQLANPLNKPCASTLHPLPVASVLFQRWGIDLVGPLKETLLHYSMHVTHQIKWHERKNVLN